MSQFLKENLYQPKNMTENRVLMLTEKINGLKIGHKAEAEKKLDTLEKQVDDLQGELESIIVNFNDKHYELKHIFSKINKELAFDYLQTDRALKEQTEQCQEMALKMISHHIEDRKASDARISRFIDEKCAIIRDFIEKQTKERSQTIKEIEGSLSRDLTEIREKLQNQSKIRQEKVEQIHANFLTEYQKMHSEFSELSDKYSESEGQFYKMLRDILKKVKSQIGEGKKEREQMQESILVLIQKICDKAMEEVGSK